MNLNESLVVSNLFISLALNKTHLFIKLLQKGANFEWNYEHRKALTGPKLNLALTHVLTKQTMDMYFGFISQLQYKVLVQYYSRSLTRWKEWFLLLATPSMPLNKDARFGVTCIRSSLCSSEVQTLLSSKLNQCIYQSNTKERFGQ